jgi:PAS domain S-box-containing protein
MKNNKRNNQNISGDEQFLVESNVILNSFFDALPLGLILVCPQPAEFVLFNTTALNLLNIEKYNSKESSIDALFDSIEGYSLDGLPLKSHDYPVGSNLIKNKENTLTFCKRTKQRPSIFVIKSSPIELHGRVNCSISTIEDISSTITLQNKLQDATFRLENLWNISKNSCITIKEVCDVTLEAIVKITKSKFGFYGFINDSKTEMSIHAWSGETMKGCSIIDKPFIYSIEHAGVWAEAVRQKKPLIINDYQGCSLPKKGYPAGHVDLKNLLVIPYFIENKMHSVVAVANKEFEYSDSDINSVTNFLNDIYSVIRRLEAEKELRSSEEKYRNLVDKMNEGIIVLNDKQIVTFANSKIHQLLEQKTCELIGSNFIRFIHKDSLEVFNKQQELRKQGSSESYELTLTNKTGDTVFVLSSPTSVFDEFNNFQGSYEIITDITKLKLYESLIIKEKEAAIAANEAKSEFLANMSHEIRTPFNGILGMLQLCQSTKLTEEQNEYINLALNSTRKLLNIINDILDLSRIEKGKQKLASGNFNLRLMMEDLVALFYPQLKGKNVTMHFMMDQSIPQTITSDETKVRQILFNLIGNSVKFTSQGTIIIQVDYINISNDTQRIIFTLSDTGCGISPSDFKKLFKPFSQIDGTSTRKYQGAGLGLSIVKRLIELLNGTICISSEIGTGTEIYFTIDVKTSSNLNGSRNRHTILLCPLPKAANVKILLAEDETINQIAIKKFIEKIGWSVDIANNGHEALNLLSQKNYDIILMDIQMPLLDGVEATKIIRGNNNKTPIIALTAHALVGDKEKFINIGMNDYISKPVEFDVLLNVIEMNLFSREKTA